MSDDPRPRARSTPRVLDFRIVRWYFKLLYAAGVWVAGYPVIGIFALLSAPSIFGSVGNSLVTLAGIILGARIFRGKDEPVAPRRPWWRMTARRTLSRVVGIIAVVSVLSTVAVFIGAAIGSEPSIRALDRITLQDGVVSTIFAAVLAFLYLNSAARLPKPSRRTRAPKFKPRMKLQ